MLQSPTDSASTEDQQLPGNVGGSRVFHRLKTTTNRPSVVDLDGSDDEERSVAEVDSGASSSVLENPAVTTIRKWSVLALPSEYEAFVEHFKSFSSTYLICERTLPEAKRTLQRLWTMSQIVKDAGGFAGPEKDVPRLARQLMYIARDTFALKWVSESPHDPENVLSLRCLRSTNAEASLCVIYCASGARMTTAEVVRAELQFRRRLLQHLEAGNAATDPLPMCDIPSRQVRTDQLLPPPRARAALQNTNSNSASTYTLDSAESLWRLVEELKAENWYDGQIAHIHLTSPREACFATPRAVLNAELHDAIHEIVNKGRSEAKLDKLQLYNHQATAIDAVLCDARNVVISTATGSGKSLVYLVAIFQAILERPGSTSILIFPTKALAQDQLRTINEMSSALVSRGITREDLRAACLDGDTPMAERTGIRNCAQIVLTNPDTLHSHILPRHSQYRRLLGELQVVVIDELHVYRGAFGAHVACIMRRLRRVAATHRDSNRKLKFISCSATLANCGDHFMRLIGPCNDAPVVVSDDFSPSGSRMHILWNPSVIGPTRRTVDEDCTEELGNKPAAKRSRTEPVVNKEETFSNAVDDGGSNVAAERPSSLTQDATPDASSDLASGFGGEVVATRRSSIVQVARLVAWLVARGFSVLAFCKWRSLVEIVLQDVQEALKQGGFHNEVRRVVSYRAGYPAAIRRDLERRIFSRDALGVVCTNALELGVDIGRLDCVLCLGFPGSLASLRQQFGRAGRAGRSGVAFFVAFDDAADQHFIRKPAELLAKEPEKLALAAANPVVLRSHLTCAASELPLTEADASWWSEAEVVSDDQCVKAECGAKFADALARCLEAGTLAKLPQRSEHETASYVAVDGAGGAGGPHSKVNIRSVDKNWEVVLSDENGGFCSRDPQGLASNSRRSVSSIDGVESSKAFYSLYPGAVYRCRGEDYSITNLDMSRRLASATKSDGQLPYYTRTCSAVSFKGLTQERKAQVASAQVSFGRVERQCKVNSFRKYWKSGDMPVEDDIPLNLPSWHLHTYGLWFTPRDFSARQLTWAGAHAAMHALLRVIPFFVVAERSDLGVACVDANGQPPLNHLQLFVYDDHDGGLGLCEEAFASARKLLVEARRLIAECPCSEGCPGCIVDFDCKEYNRTLSKSGALAWFEVLLDES